MSATDTQPTIGTFEAAQLGQGEPAWLAERRAAAWQAYRESAAPEWRRTDLRALDLVALQPLRGTAHTSLTKPATAGVTFVPLLDAVRSQPAVVEARLGTAIDASTHRYNALNAALWQDGALLHVAKDVAVEEPLRMTVGGAAGAATTARTIIVLERNASATFIEEFRGDTAFASSVTEIFLEPGAMLRYVVVQSWNGGAYHIGSQRAMVGNDATIEWTTINLGGKLQHVEAETALQGNGSRVDWKAATFATENQSLLTAPWLRHIGAATEAHMDFKTVVKDASYATFDGMIKIEHGSQATITRLEEHALHLTPKARSDSIPGLMIDTNDVARAGHASTSGEVDEEQLFYMRSRGIARADAMRLIVAGFFEPVLDRVPDHALREQISAQIDERIG